MNDQFKPTAILTLEGDVCRAVLLAPSAHTDKWTEAWEIIAREPSIGQPRWYLVRLEIDARCAIGYAVIDDRICADARAAGLPDSLGVTARIVAILPEEMTAAQERWVVKQHAMYIAREAPDPPHLDYELSTWRTVLGVLVQAVQDKHVRDSLTA